MEVSIFAFVCVGNFTNGNYKEFHSLAKGGSDISISPNYPSFQQLAPFSVALNYNPLFPSAPVAAHCLLLPLCNCIKFSLCFKLFHAEA